MIMVQPTSVKQNLIMSPGPQDYSPIKKEIQRTPNWKFGNQKRDMYLKEHKDQLGPGCYQIPHEAIQQNKAIVFPMGERYIEDRRRNKVPGPGHYNPQNITRTAPSYSLSYKVTDENNKSIQPGPGYYFPTQIDESKNLSAYRQDKSSQNKKTSKFNQALRDLSKEESLKIPGPGSKKLLYFTNRKDYEIEKAQKAVAQRITPQWAFGKCRRDNYNLNDEIPGPGDYQIKDNFTTNKGYTIASRSFEKIQSVRFPGPATYKNNLSLIKPSTAAHRIGTSPRPDVVNLKQNISPGPANYSQMIPYSFAPAHKIGQSKRQEIQQQYSPGPAAYFQEQKIQIKTQVVENKYIIAKPRRSYYVKDTPGPCDYDPQKSYAHFPAARIGSSDRSVKQQTKDLPAPNSYNITLQVSSPIWKIGKANRIQSALKNKPGPGSYDIPTSFLDRSKHIRSRNVRKLNNKTDKTSISDKD